MSKKPVMQLSCVFQFAASHFLTKYHGKCENLHGHNYKIIVTVEGKMQEDGMVMDYKIIKEIVKERVISKVDHTHLNDLLENPSSEHLAIWIWQQIVPEIPILKKITVYETDQYYCEYQGS